MAEILIDASFDAKLKANHIEKMKELERQAIEAYLFGKSMTIANRSRSLDAALKEQEEQMKSISNRFASNLEGGFSGTAGDAAKTYLNELKKPNLLSPIQ